MSESRAMIVRAGGDPSRLIVVNRPTRRVVSSGIPGAGGTDGRSITSVDIDGSNHLIITYSDATTSDAGLLPGSASWGSITGTLSTQADLQSALDGKATSAQGALADSAVQPGDLAAVATSGAYNDIAGKPTLGTAAATDAAAYATAAQGDKADSAVQPAALTSALAGKVDVDGAKVLSDENYTSAEKSKLAGLESSHWRGLYASLVALEAAHPTASAGDYADVDTGTGFATTRHLWDVDDAEWIPSGSGAPLSAADVKSLYESNADTNAYTDTEKTKLAGVATGANNYSHPNHSGDVTSTGDGATVIANDAVTNAKAANMANATIKGRSTAGTGDPEDLTATQVRTLLNVASGATANDTDANLKNRANHTGTQAQSTVTNLTTDLAAKQATLVSGTNIKTVNGASVLGSGDLTVSAAPAAVITESTTSRTLGLTDAGKFIDFTNASASIVTVAPQASVTWLADTEIYIYRDAAGNLTITPGAGVTLKAPSGGTLVLTNAMGVMLKRISSDTWLVIGQTVAA